MDLDLLFAHRLLIKQGSMLREHVKLLLRVVEGWVAELVLKVRVAKDLDAILRSFWLREIVCN